MEQERLVPPPAQGILPRSKRECCFVFFAVVAVLAVAVGVGLGVGLYVSNWDKNADSSREVVIGEPGEPVPVGDGTGTNDTTPSSFPTFVNGSSPSDGFADGIEYHVINYGISNGTSFFSDDTLTPQQRALDFLAIYDRVPVGLADEENETSTSQVRAKPQLKTEAYLTSATPAYRIVQRYAMATFYYATEGEGWETDELWVGAGVHECEWVGVICKQVDIPAFSLREVMDNPEDIPSYNDESVDTVSERFVTEINLPENNLKGYLPREIAGLPFLQTLGLWSNMIGDTVPEQIGNLTNLRGLHLDDNQFEGSIPPQIGLLGELQDVSLANNNFYGEIPAEILELEKLERLWLYNNELEGSLPDISYEKIQGLQDLNLKNNKLDGSLPNGLKDLINLESLDLSSNVFSGPIPSSWSSLPKLKNLALNNNKLRGQVPNIFDSFPNLESIALDINGFIGTLPSTIGSAAPSLKKLTLGENKFEGEIPESLRDCTKLRQLEMNSNQLRGSLPTWIGGLIRLEYLDVSDNMFSGEVPSELSDLSVIKELRLDSNLLVGTVPCPFSQASGESLAKLMWFILAFV
jgi:Leucine-rich repeat (LRR) protein